MHSKDWGSSRTGAFFSLGPFIGALVSLFIFRNSIGWLMLPAFLFMALGIWFIVRERHSHSHLHTAVTHTHSHQHDDLHHAHKHPQVIVGAHTHEHVHSGLEHSHSHWPDIHHRHAH